MNGVRYAVAGSTFSIPAILTEPSHHLTFIFRSAGLWTNTNIVTKVTVFSAPPHDLDYYRIERMKIFEYHES